ncbi:MAG: hypothetical protein IKM43_02805 [Clostridia bacterium]|nr:hypothetical protein [Clostridia bacterium]
MKSKQLANNFSELSFDYFGESLILDCGEPIFKDSLNKVYCQAPSLESFKICFNKLKEQYLVTINPDLFKSLAIQLAKRRHYPKIEAEKYINNCVMQIKSLQKENFLNL